MKNTFKKIYALLTIQERRQTYRIFVLIIIMALLEMVGVVSIFPFFSVLSEPDIVINNQYFAKIYQYLNFTDNVSFIYFLGFVVVFTAVVSISFKAFTTYKLLHYTEMRSYSLSRRMVEGYLNQPYDWFLNRHSADLGKTILSEVQQVVGGALIPMMHLISTGIIALTLIILLMFVDPVLTISVMFVLISFYAMIYLLLRNYLRCIGLDRVEANKQRYHTVQEIFGGIKDVKVKGLETELLHRFETPARNYAQKQTASQIASQLPRFLLEAVSLAGMMLVILYLMSDFGGLQKALPVLALYAFTGYRLMPALQNMYAQLSALRFSGPALDVLHKDLTLYASGNNINEVYKPDSKLLLKTGLKLEGVTYSYPKTHFPTIDNISVEIPVHTTTGIVGVTGSGKTTTVDLLLGLLQPEKGSFLVDDTVINKNNIRSWQHNVGYVPQHIYLADDSVAANIAFGVPKDQINKNAVVQAARIASLHDFVIHDMPDAYETLVGERGVRLSGGQRQRIGIARALYHDPDVLILDEATSALDNLTEQAVMDAVHNIGHKKTVIIIAHRLSTVRDCDQIVLLESGKVSEQGSYEEMIDKSDKFRAMAKSI